MRNIINNNVLKRSKQKYCY